MMAGSRGSITSELMTLPGGPILFQVLLFTCRTTTSVTEAACCNPPPVPVMLSGNVPAGVVALVLSVITEDCGAELLRVTDDGLKLRRVSPGTPPALRVTSPVKPSSGEIAMV